MKVAMELHSSGVQKGLNKILNKNQASSGGAPQMTYQSMVKT